MKWQMEVLKSMAAARRTELNPATAAKLRATNRRQALELGI